MVYGRRVGRAAHGVEVVIRHRKLALRGETVRVLGSLDLRRANGGMAQNTDLCQSDEAGLCVPPTCTSGGSSADISRTIACGPY